MTSGSSLLAEVLPVLGLTADDAARVLHIGSGDFLPSVLPVGALAVGSVAAAGLAGCALGRGHRVRVDPRQVAVSFRADQLQTVDGSRTPGFAPLSGLFRASDGWVRTHANYPHHRERLLRAMGLEPTAGPEELVVAVGRSRAQDVEDAVVARDGIAVRVRTWEEWRSGAQAAAVDRHELLRVSTADGVRPGDVVGAAPVGSDDPDGAVGRRRGHRARAGHGSVPGRPRVLDLTRVIAGPVATRTLALLGCDVLRVDSPDLPELEPQHLDTDCGKRSTLLDLDDRHDLVRLHELLAEADVLVTGYRPGALAAYGLDAATVAERHPQVVHASLSAWTTSGPWGGRRGFDSIVQAASGIALLESADDGRPGALPAQALDHATGYLLAAGVLGALRARAVSGGTWSVSAHLARTAHWLLRAERRTSPAPAAHVADAAPWMVETTTPSGTVQHSRPALQIDDGPTEFAWVGRPWGADAPAWDD
ncbi:MAG: CoA transferase [Dermatophilaceae bacterium]